MTRFQNRAYHQLRTIHLHRHFTLHAEGSVLIDMGNTRVLCNATLQTGVPAHKKGTGEGWVTAEYAMLPRSTHTRNDRESAKGKQNARSQEIQRLIGRSLRAIFDLKKLGEHTLILDCDVIQADGGTRCASITGAVVAAHDAVAAMIKAGKITQNPINQAIAAVSVGLKNSIPMLDLDYSEDSTCDTDMNVVMTADGQLVEIQGTAEGKTFTRFEMNQMMDLAESGIKDLIQIQKQALRIP